MSSPSQVRPRKAGGLQIAARPRVATAGGGTAADRVANYLVAHIRRHQLRSGTNVPSEIKVSQELDISRGAVREAYRSLASTGVLDIANGRSPRVGHLNGRAFSHVLEHGLSTEQISQAHVFDARRTLEIRAVALAAQYRTQDHIDRLHEAVDDMRRAERSHAPFIAADLRFHDVIGKASANPLFQVLGSAIRQSLDTAIRAGRHSERSPEELAGLVDVHAAIAEAVAKRRPAQAQRLMRTHFDDTWRYVFGDAPAKS